MPAIKSAKNTAKKAAKELAARPVLYPKVQCMVYDAEHPLTVEKAKELLGWEEEPEEGPKFGKMEFLLKDRNGKKIRCHNNPVNRPFYLKDACEPIVRTILNRVEWKLNGETVIIGKTGLVLNGQHQLVGLVLAEQDRTGENAAKFKKIWGEESVSMTKVVVVGIEEDRVTLDTMDTCKPRSLEDVLYCSGYFSNTSPHERETLSKIMANALKFLWSRTGHYMRNGVSVKGARTHPESMDFLKRHPKLVEAVRYIFDENAPSKEAREPGEPKPPQRIAFENSVQLGVASALLYLMGCSASEKEAYYHMESPTEKKLDWSKWDKAQEFWTLIAAEDKELRPIRQALATVLGEEGEGKVSKPVAIAIFVNAWNQWSEGGKLTLKNIYPELEEVEVDGVLSKKLTFHPPVGPKGIDLGKVKENGDEEEDEATEEEAEEAKESVRAEKELAAVVSTNGDGQVDEDENG